MAAATSDDLLSILSIYRSCTEPQLTEDGDSTLDRQHEKTPINVNDWARVITELPKQRNCVSRTLSDVISALEKYKSSSGSSAAGGFMLQHELPDASILEELETAAMSLRDATGTYSSSIQSFIHVISIFLDCNPCNTDCTESLTRVAVLLASQLVKQLQWDAGLLTVLLRFLDEDMYINSTSDVDSMKTYANAFSSMLRIDKPFWNMAGVRALDDFRLLDTDGVDTTTTLDRTGSSFLADALSCADDNDELKQASSIFTSLHEHIISQDSVEEAIKSFASDTKNKLLRSNQWPQITSLLVIGDEGCGKSFLLDSIQKYTDQANDPSLKAVRPTHHDFTGNTVGSSEDSWISLFSYAESEIKEGNKVLILLDDIDTLLSLHGMGGVSSTGYQVGRRCKALFLSIIDSLKDTSHKYPGHLMIVCTGRSNCEEISCRMDRIFNLSQMDEIRRRGMILDCLSTWGIGSDDISPELDETILALVVKHTAGRTAFELSQCCRDAILSEVDSRNNCEGVNDRRNLLEARLRHLDKIMQTKSPQSLRSGSLDGVVNMIVITPDELIARLDTDDFGEAALPLLGADAKRAYESLMNTVITPLCRSEKIVSLLYGGESFKESASKPVRVGVLLSGAAGVGKTSLAYHCASVAALMSGVTLLDVSCTSLIHKEIGGSERAVHCLFESVRAAAPCILLLDGIENVAPRRGNDYTTEGTMDRVLSTFLTEMDGIEGNGMSGNVGVIGITYNAELIDPSLLRPGRLEKTIKLETPDFEARKDLVSQSIEGLEFDFSSAGYFDPRSKDDISHYVAMESSGMSAVETIAICKEAAMECLRDLDFDVSMSPLLKHHHFKSAINIMKGKTT